MVLMPSGHRLADRSFMDLSELKGEPLILFSPTLGRGLDEEVIESCRRARFEPTVAQIAPPQITSIVNLVAVGLGASMVPAHVANIQVPGVVALRVTGSAPVARLALVTRLDDRSVVTRNFRLLVQKVAHAPATADDEIVARLTEPPTA